MSCRYPRYDPKFGCVHEKSIHDQHTGTIVCLLCGLVLEEGLPYCNNETRVSCNTPSQKKESIDLADKEWAKYLTKKHDNLAFRTAEEFIADVGELWHIPKADKNKIYNNYKRIIQKLVIQKALKYKPEEILGYALYQHMINNDYAYTIDDIMQILSKTNVKFICNIQNELQENLGPHLQTICNKIGNALNLDAKSKLFIGSLCKKFRQANSLQQPKTFCTLITLWFCRIHYPHMFSDKQIVKAANVNYNHIKSVEKLVKTFQKDVNEACYKYDFKK